MYFSYGVNIVAGDSGISSCVPWNASDVIRGTFASLSLLYHNGLLISEDSDLIVSFLCDFDLESDSDSILSGNGLPL